MKKSTLKNILLPPNATALGKPLLKTIETIPFKVKELFTKIDNNLSQWECFKSSAERYQQNEIKQPQIKGKQICSTYSNGVRKYYRNGVEL
jgi:hypothetical protein